MTIPGMTELQIKELQTVNKKCYVNIGEVYVATSLDDILYFYAENKQLYLRTKIETFLIKASSLKALETQLSEYSFIRISRKYLVNFNKVQSLSLQDGKLYLGMSSK